MIGYAMGFFCSRRLAAARNRRPRTLSDRIVACTKGWACPRCRIRWTDLNGKPPRKR